MTEYMQSVVTMYKRGMQAAEIAVELKRTVSAINSVLYSARKSGLIVMKPGEAEMRRKIGQLKAFEGRLPRRNS